jgi:hypothetical protein
MRSSGRAKPDVEERAEFFENRTAALTKTCSGLMLELAETENEKVRLARLHCLAAARDAESTDQLRLRQERKLLLHLAAKLPRSPRAPSPRPRIAVSLATIRSRAKKETNLLAKARLEIATAGARDHVAPPKPAIIRKSPGERHSPHTTPPLRPLAPSIPEWAVQLAGQGRTDARGRRSQPSAAAPPLELPKLGPVVTSVDADRAFQAGEDRRTGRKTEPIDQDGYGSDSSQAHRKRFEREVRKQARRDARMCVVSAIEKTMHVFQNEELHYANPPSSTPNSKRF